MTVSQPTQEATGDRQRAAPRDPRIGTTVGEEFVVDEQLGAGGMGAVYVARQKVTERKVAIKILHPFLIHQSIIDRFEQEAQIASKLNHPNIVTVYKYGELEDGGLYLAMEFVEGRPLDDLIATGAMQDLKRALPLMIQCAEALATAHDQRIVHRDIKPGNIMVTKAGRKEIVKVLDFGIAKVMDDSAIVTKTGMLCGSPEYMSPEQWRQLRDIDGRSDIYSLGCVFYEMLTARLPFEATSVPGYMMKHVGTEATRLDLRLPGLVRYPRLVRVIQRCLAKDREDRYADAYQLVEELREAEDEIRANPSTLAVTTEPGLTQMMSSPTLVDSKGPDTAPDAASLAFLDDIAFDDDAPIDARPDDLGQLRRKHSKVNIASPADGFDIDVAHTGPQGVLHKALLVVGMLQLGFLGSSIAYLVLNPPTAASQTGAAETEHPAPENTD